jgi:hypothetical protein
MGAYRRAPDSFRATNLVLSAPSGRVQGEVSQCKQSRKINSLLSPTWLGTVQQSRGSPFWHARTSRTTGLSLGEKFRAEREPFRQSGNSQNQISKLSS